MANRPMPMFVPNFGPGAEMMGQQQLTPYVTTQDLPQNMPREGEQIDYERLFNNLIASGAIGIGGALTGAGAGLFGVPMMGAGAAGLYDSNRGDIDGRSYMKKHFTDQTNRLPGYTPWDMLRQGGKY